MSTCTNTWKRFLPVFSKTCCVLVSSKHISSSAPRRDESQGFVNFFGAQRFGRDGTNSVEVGLMMLRSDWAGAVRRILEPHPADGKEVSTAKQAFFSSVDIGGDEPRDHRQREDDAARVALR